MNRITNKDLEGVVNRINRVTGSPETPYIKTETGVKAQVGNYHLDSAYGGVKLVRMESESGGVSDTLRCGYVTKRELYNLMHAFLTGLEQE